MAEAPGSAAPCADIAGFLAAAGWGAARRRPLAGDASARRYERLEDGPRRAILMITTPDETERFARIGAWLAAQGCSAPAVLAAAGGLSLLEDFGDDLAARRLAACPAWEPEFYGALTDLLARLAPRPAPAGLAALTPAALGDLAALYAQWYLPACGLEGAALARDLPEMIAERAEALGLRPEGLSLRDLHAENVIWLPRRAGLARLGLLDFQDAVLAPPAYDLVSALQDARRDVALPVETAQRVRLAERLGLPAAPFEAGYALLGAQRALRILGVFARLARRDGKPQYLAHVPRVRAHLLRNLAHPALGPLARLLEGHLPELRP